MAAAADPEYANILLQNIGDATQYTAAKVDKLAINISHLTMGTEVAIWIAFLALAAAVIALLMVRKEISRYRTQKTEMFERMYGGPMRNDQRPFIRRKHPVDLAEAIDPLVLQRFQELADIINNHHEGNGHDITRSRL